MKTPYIFSLLGGYRALEALRFKQPNELTDAMQPLFSASTEAVKPALLGPEIVDRVMACPFKASISQQMALLKAETFVHTPPLVARLSRVFIVGGHLLSGKSWYVMRRSLPPQSLLFGADMPSFGEAALVNSYQGLHYFGHWLRDDCAVFELIEDLPRVSLQRPEWADRRGYEQLFEQHWSEISYGYFEKLHVYRELGVNGSKRQRFLSLRDRVRRNLPNTSCGVVYLRRASTLDGRTAANEAELMNTLAARGVAIVDSTSGAQSLLTAALDADVIITHEGSQAAHALLALQQHGSLIMLQSPYRFYNPHLEWTRLLGMGYGTIVGRATDEGFTISPDEVLQMLDLLKP